MLQVSAILVPVALGFGFVAAQLLYMALVVALKWVVLRRSIPGRYHAYSQYGLRFSLVQSWLSGPLARAFCTFFADTPLVPVVLRALGAQLEGRNIIFRLSPAMLAGADQLVLREMATLGNDVAVLGAALIGDTVLIAPTTVGSR